ncbi:hypothetical protein COT78_03440 [Candidatus Berkelbacteria bacterium CG10_big_fil_rev_8_21_14_0_10_43_13]|uniref:Uncharacterized protein n=1 Tax=Candidatus Berkelbacteria bacterium CG10_big_fil_rev_8_21_14_0_10_43_13 TaxID=1974514 RepID=A0A2H0W5W6_9BACT|nr:MAG: hypothetical protein COT78_03440 [Candidatus Berkelbacteria bacterium CG10_big_fil_rev_8_21_14_0_10_43_13]
MCFSTLDKLNALVKIGLMPVIQTGTTHATGGIIVLTATTPDALGPKAKAFLGVIKACNTTCPGLLMQRAGAYQVLDLAKEARPELIRTLQCTDDCDDLGQHGLWLVDKLATFASEVISHSSEVENDGC